MYKSDWLAACAGMEKGHLSQLATLVPKEECVSPCGGREATTGVQHGGWI